MAKTTTPMLDQYWALKNQHPQALLFFRLGDFYELFDHDAEVASPVLDLQLTSRDGRVAMCGVPYHAGMQHARRLLDQGFTVAIAEQMESPGDTKGLVDRQIVRVLTPGTVIPEEHEKSPRLGVAYRHRQGWAIIMAELSTGTVHILEVGTARAQEEHLAHWWRVWSPQEFLANSEEAWLQGGVRIDDSKYFRRADPLQTERLLSVKLGLESLRRWGLDERLHVHQALSALARYLDHVHPGTLKHLKDIRIHSLTTEMRISSQSLAQLDVSSSSLSLSSQWNRCRTKMGSRRLTEWIEHPLTERNRIEARHRIVRHWVNHAVEHQQVGEWLYRVGDLSRRISRVGMGLGSPKDIEGIRQAVLMLPNLWPIHEKGLWPAPRDLDEAVWQSFTSTLSVLHQPAPSRWEDTPIIGDGHDPDIDAFRALLTDHRQALLKLEEDERERSQLRSLKVGYHRTFGYYLEVTKSQSHKVPSDWVRRQTTAHAERFVSDSLRQLEKAIEDAQDQLNQREHEWADRLKAFVVENSRWLVPAAGWLSELDALWSMAEVAVSHRLTEPHLLDPDQPVTLRGLRHPALESVVGEYVKSDLELPSSHTALIITGPNMGGKSTFMRAVAQNAILAQSGSWVACDYYAAPIFNAVLTRIGADDDLVRGQSTFMVEMEEVAAILHEASKDSLVLLDELGRGTATYDGMAIAHAVIERLADKAGPLTLCATHYHELTALEDNNPNIMNLTAEVISGDDGPIFTHRVIKGQASQSYGLEVAKQAGLPPAVIRRAEYHLKQWEPERGMERVTAAQITFENPDPVAQAVATALKELVLDDLSPREAWLYLKDLQHKLHRGVTP